MGTFVRECWKRSSGKHKGDEVMKEVIDLLKRYTNGKQNTDKVEISVLQLNRVIKALEQEHLLDNIRDEIVDAGAYEQEVNGMTEFLKGITYCLRVIDEYREE